VTLADPRSTGDGRGASPEPVPTVFLGSGSFAEPILARLAAHRSVRVAAVVTAPPRPVGRRGIETPTPVHRAARALGLRVLTPARLRDPAALAGILDLDPALVVLADYGQLVPAALLDAPHGALNLHPSLLPRHRGATPVPGAILAGDAETGVTLMRMDAGLDTGPIVAVERTAVGPRETAPELEARLAVVAAELLGSCLDPWLSGEAIARPQPEEGATLTRPLRREDGRLDPALSAEQLERQVRAYLPWPGSYIETDDARVAVLAASVAPADAADVPGTVVADGDGLSLATADGRLVLREVHPAGGRPMTGAELVRGRPSIVGSIVVPTVRG
jgi:methionyl-tRNA formyltransferase